MKYTKGKWVFEKWGPGMSVWRHHSIANTNGTYEALKKLITEVESLAKKALARALGE